MPEIKIYYGHYHFLLVCLMSFALTFASFYYAYLGIIAL
jgi:hypothetical protein